MLKHRLLDYCNNIISDVDWLSMYERHIEPASWDPTEFLTILLAIIYRDEINGNTKNLAKLNACFMTFKDKEEQQLMSSLQLLWTISFLEEAAMCSHSPNSLCKSLYI